MCILLAASVRVLCRPRRRADGTGVTEKHSPLRPRPRPGVDAVATLLGCKPDFPCHSPTLRPWIADSASYVEGLWSPRLTRFRQKSKLKHTLIHKRSFRGETPSGFLSQAGP